LKPTGNATLTDPIGAPIGSTNPQATAGRSQAKLVLFDLDNTLLDGDSDVLWCQFLMDAGVLDPARFGPRNAAMEHAYQAGTVSVREFSEFYVGTLAGRSAAQWQPLLQRFVQEVISPRISPAAHALVQQPLQAGALVVLTTATNRFITVPTARLLGIEHLIATECEVGADGLFTGCTTGTLNMREGKVQRLQDWLSTCESNRWLDERSANQRPHLSDFDSWAYSDSMNDLPLLSAVDHAVAVNPDARLAAEAQRRGWPTLQLRAQK
jgi:HAD superfamily hydrolase (TIGR01490 family)